MNKYLVQCVYLLTLLNLPLIGYSKKIIRPSEFPTNLNATYLGFTLGKNFSNFRDFATSPLIYNGTPTYLGMTRIKQKRNKENELGLNYSFGNYSTSVGTESSSSKVKTFSGYYSRLYTVRSGKYQVKVGGLANVAFNTRVNTDLNNNAFGSEIFATISGTAKLSADVSRRNAKKKKFLFIKYNLKPRKRTFDARVNIGILNNTFRNGFAYIGQSSVLNDGKLFDGYNFKFLSGMRFSTALDYTVYLNNNAVRLSYMWDAYKTSGKLDKFEMAHHVVGFTFLLNTK